MEVTSRSQRLRRRRLERRFGPRPPEDGLVLLENQLRTPEQVQREARFNLEFGDVPDFRSDPTYRLR